MAVGNGPALTQRLFAAMWAGAHLVHLANQTEGAFRTVTGTLTFLVALATLRFLGDSRWLLGLAAAQLLDVAWHTASSPDHWNLVAVVNVALLLTWLGNRSTEGLVERAAPSIRLVVVIAYSAAAISKWNSSFFDPESSCGVALASLGSFTLTERVPQLDWLHIGLAVAAESAVAITLAVPRLRRHGALLGLSFHFLVSLSPALRVADFTAILYALFVLFLPEEQRILLAARVRDSVARLADVPAGLALAVAVFAGGLLGHAVPAASQGILWLTVTVSFATVLRHAWTTRVSGGPSVRAWRLNPATLVAGSLVLLLAASPYIGGRTTGVFTMFSNLRTEAVGTNHYFMPVADLGTWQDEVVRLESASSGILQDWADDGLLLPRVDLARRLHADPELEVVAMVDGQRTEFGPDGSGLASPPWYVRSFGTFRGVDAPGPSPCGG